jgi:hypothetical protein
MDLLNRRGSFALGFSGIADLPERLDYLALADLLPEILGDRDAHRVGGAAAT